jgi:hypothetical protein
MSYPGDFLSFNAFMGFPTNDENLVLRLKQVKKWGLTYFRVLDFA